MKKNRIIAIFTVIAVVLTLATCYVIYSYLEPKRQTVYVFNDNYARGTQITDDILTPVKVDSKIMVANSSSNVEDQFVTPAYYAEIRKGQYLRMDVAEGMPLTFAMTSGNDSQVANSMQSTAVAITIPVNGITGVTNELTPESLVNVYCAIEDSVQLILQKMKVLSVFYSDGSIYAVSLETTIEESMKLVYAENFGAIYLGLVDGTGYQVEEDPENLYFALGESSSTYDDSAASSVFGDYMASLDEDMEDLENADDESTGYEPETQSGDEEDLPEDVPEDEDGGAGVPEENITFDELEGTVMPDVG